MPKRDRKSEEDWEKVKAVVNKMLDRGDTIVSIMINKDSKTVEFCGPDHMKGFGQRIANDFVQAATKIEVCAPSINLGVATMDIDNANTHNIRKVMADIVNTDVFSRLNIQRGFWGIRKLAPEWYPEEVPFVSPNDNKNSCCTSHKFSDTYLFSPEERLSRAQCVSVVESYKTFVLKGICSSKSEQTFTDTSTSKDRMEDDDFKESQPKKMCTEHSSPDAGVSTSIEDDSLSTNEIDRQKAAIKIAKIWEDQIAPWSHYFIAKVYGTSITYGDIYSLKKNSWVTDKIMDAYLELVANREMANGIKIKHMLVTTTNNILNGEYVPARNDKNILMSTEFIIGAYHQSGSHWDLLIIEPLNGRIIFLNPMGETDFQMRTVPLRWKKFIEQLLLQFPADAAVIDKEWNLEVPTHSKQQDGSSCGIYCLMFADKYLARTSLHITPAESNQKRKSIARSLMMFEGYMEGCCPCCGYHTNPVAEPLVKCITCCKFFHKKSHCVGENVDQLNLTEFTCALDRV